MYTYSITNIYQSKYLRYNLYTFSLFVIKNEILSNLEELDNFNIF